MRVSTVVLVQMNLALACSVMAQIDTSICPLARIWISIGQVATTTVVTASLQRSIAYLPNRGESCVLKCQWSRRAAIDRGIWRQGVDYRSRSGHSIHNPVGPFSGTALQTLRVPCRACSWKTLYLAPRRYCCAFTSATTRRVVIQPTSRHKVRRVGGCSLPVDGYGNREHFDFPRPCNGDSSLPWFCGRMSSIPASHGSGLLFRQRGNARRNLWTLRHQILGGSFTANRRPKCSA